MNFQSLDELKNLENLVRSGQLTKVTSALKRLNSAKIPREHLARYANLANRVGLSRFAFRILNPIMRGEKRIAHEPMDQEKIEYAGALRRLGLIDEAMHFLQSLDSDMHPVVLLQMGFCLISEWR